MTNKALDWNEVKQLHIDTFGVEPVITGTNFEESDNIIVWVVEAIQAGRPYVEENVPEHTEI